MVRLKYLFFLIIIPFLLIPTASAEVGKNFDTVTQLDGSVVWTSHYERILENGRYVNHIVNDKAGVFEYRTGNISFDFDKVDCSFTLYNPITNVPVIPNFRSEFVPNGQSKQVSIIEKTRKAPFCALLEYVHSTNPKASILKSVL